MASDTIPTITISSSNSDDVISSSSPSVNIPSGSQTRLAGPSSSTTVVQTTAADTQEEGLPIDGGSGSSDEQAAQKPATSRAPSSSNSTARGSDTNLPRTNSGPPMSIKQTRQHRGHKSTSHQKAAADDSTPWHGVVLDHSPNPQKEQVVVFPSKMVHASPNIPYNNSWAFQRALIVNDLIGCGFVFLQVNGEKARKNVKDNTYVFIVLEGTVEATVHQTQYVISTGGVFLVPIGNDYSIRNVSEKEAKLFFAQAARPAVAPSRGGVGGIWRLDRPTSKSLMLVHSLIQWLKLHIVRLRAQGFAWYWKYLARYRHHLAGRKLYFICFLLGLIIRRLPFVGSPPILNIQLVRIR